MSSWIGAAAAAVSHPSLGWSLRFRWSFSSAAVFVRGLYSEKVGYRIIRSNCHLYLANCYFFVYSFIIVVIIVHRYFKPIICFCIVDFDGLRWDFDIRIGRLLDLRLETGALCSFDFGFRRMSWREQ